MSEFCLKDETVFTFKEQNGVPVDIGEVKNPELIPVALQKELTFTAFLDWLKRRGMPEQREGRSEAIKNFGSDWTVPLSGLVISKDTKDFNYQSLSDHYWIKKRDETWKSINFFTNKYNPIIGDMMLKPWTVTERRISCKSPELTTTGLVRKRWRQENGGLDSYLVKAGSYALQQEPLNEVIVSTLIEKINSESIKSAGYNLAIEGVTMCSRCKNFITPEIDMVTAADIYKMEPRENEDVYSHLCRMCEKYDIPDARDHIDWLIWLDLYTGNEDRHLNNIAFIRDLKTMKFIGPSPAFDFGNAYWNTKNTKNSTKNRLFDKSAAWIYKRIMPKVDLSRFAKDKEFNALINKYPNISDAKKENLIKAIEKKNREMELQVELSER